VTACVIARDEEERLPACLESLAWCDEIVVVDGGSRDRTTEVARAAGARVVENPWPGFAAQRNVALDHAHGDWALEVDADERVTPELAREIAALLHDPPSDMDMAAIPRREVFLDRPLGPAARYPAYVHRLFRRNRGLRHDETRAVHEGLLPEGPTLPLEAELTHLLASTWREAVRDARAYAKLEATQRSRVGPLEALVGTLLRPAAKFAYRLLLYGGWRDGWRGVAKLGLECGGDTLATLYRLWGEGIEGGEAGFGQQPPRTGAVRLVGIALSDERCARLCRWLEAAGGAGADVSLICTEPPRSTPVRCRALTRATPGALVRALDAEEQLRPIDAVVPAGGRERLLLRAVPAALRGEGAALSPSSAPSAAVRDLRPQPNTQVAS
jgi:hypothetical protein